jgi:hypothetical protein
MHDLECRGAVNPRLIGCQIAYEAGVEPLFRKIFRDIGKEMGFALRFESETHRGIWLEYAIADYCAGVHLFRQLPGNWAFDSPVPARLRARPGLQTLQIAYESDVQPLLERVAWEVSRGLGVPLSTRNPIHLGVLLEVICVTYYLYPNGYRWVGRGLTNRS